MNKIEIKQVLNQNYQLCPGIKLKEVTKKEEKSKKRTHYVKFFKRGKEIAEGRGDPACVLSYGIQIGVPTKDIMAGLHFLGGKKFKKEPIALFIKGGLTQKLWGVKKGS